MNAYVFDFPDAPKNKILSYKEDSVDWDIDIKEFKDKLQRSQLDLDLTEEETNRITNIPRIPDTLPNGLFPYQCEAIEKWKK